VGNNTNLITDVRLASLFRNTGLDRDTAERITEVFDERYPYLIGYRAMDVSYYMGNTVMRTLRMLENSSVTDIRREFGKRKSRFAKFDHLDIYRKIEYDVW
jgi:hypothetical protein